MVHVKKVCKTVKVYDSKLTPKSRSARVTNPKTGKVRKTAGGKDVRSFTLVSINGKESKLTSPDGSERYAEGATPAGNASKLFSHWCKENKKTEVPKTIVVIKETTRNSLAKEYSYECSRKKLAKPEVINNIVHKFKNSCKSYKKLKA